MTIDPNDATARLSGVTDGTPFLDLTNEAGPMRWHWVADRQNWVRFGTGFVFSVTVPTSMMLADYPLDRARIEAMAR